MTQTQHTPGVGMSKPEPVTDEQAEAVIRDYLLRQELHEDWPKFCDADHVAPDFIDRMEAAGFIELADATRADEDMFWVAKYGSERPDFTWQLTTEGRAAISKATGAS